LRARDRQLDDAERRRWSAMRGEFEAVAPRLDRVAGAAMVAGSPPTRRGSTSRSPARRSPPPTGSSSIERRNEVASSATMAARDLS
jgi:hypothetical protein